MHNWEQDAPDDIEDNHLDHKDESDGKFNDHVWNAEDPHPEVMQVEEEAENWEDNVEPEEVSDHDVEAKEEIKYPYDSYNQSEVEHEDKSDNEEDQVEDPSWDRNHDLFHFWHDSLGNIWACGIKIVGRLQGCLHN